MSSEKLNSGVTIRVSLNEMRNVYASYPKEGSSFFDDITQGELWLKDVIGFPPSFRKNAAVLLKALAFGERYNSANDQELELGRIVPPIAIFPDSYSAVRLPPIAYYDNRRVIGISSVFLEQLASSDLNELIKKGSGDDLYFVGTPQEYMVLLGIEERNHANFFSKYYTGSYPPVIYAPDKLSTDQYDAQPQELSALIEMLEYAIQTKLRVEEIILLKERIRKARTYKFSAETINAYREKGYDLVALSQQERDRSYQILPE